MLNGPGWSQTSAFLLTSAQTHGFLQNAFWILQEEREIEGIINAKWQSCAEELMESQWQEEGKEGK